MSALRQIDSRGRFVPVPEEERFWSKVDRSGGPDACWEWQASTDRGYGIVWMGQRLVKAHRAAWQFTNGPIPTGLSVCHHCDNRPCCNPAHLFVGTAADNMRDAAAKGRMRNRPTPGESHHAARLTEADVRAIRAAEGYTQEELAARYGVVRGTISDIRLRKRWRCVP